MPTVDQTYDIVILGGGTAGCVLASRLSASLPSLRILMLEAGVNHNDDPRVRIPGLFPQTYGDPTLDYGYYTTPQPALNGTRIYHSRGKGLGGSSLINYMALVHPSKSGMNAWAEVGNPGWGWDDMLPYLRKYQTWHEPSPDVAEMLHLDEYIDKSAQGKEGPVQASYNNADVLPPTSLNRAWLETFRNIGWDMRGDTLSGTNVGAYHCASAVDAQSRERSHAAVAYLEPAMKDGRPNLNVVTGCVVDKVLFEAAENGSKPKAKGVQFLHGEQTYVVEASREIVLCSGTFGNIGILERSGIGSGEHLNSLGVEVVVQNENVGENLQDHLMCGVSFEVKEGCDTSERFKDEAVIGAAVAQYQQDRTGPLSATSGSMAYMPLLEEGEDKSADGTIFQQLIDKYQSERQIKLEKNSAAAWSEAYTLSVLRNPTEASANFCMVTGQAHTDKITLKDAWVFSNPGYFTSLFVALAHPLSRGSVHATSLVPTDAPEIDPAYCSHPLDLELLARHVRLFHRIMHTAPMNSLLKPGGQCIPEWASFDSVDDTKKLVQSSPMSNQHPCGTCAMLPKDKGGVVDSKLKVYGVEGLRICDASIMPLIPRGNLMSTVYAIAEKGADILREDLASA